MSTVSPVSIESFFDPDTCTISYLVVEAQTLECAVIDSVLDFDPKSGRTHTASADRIVARIVELNATVRWIMETHVHADHLSAAAYVKAKLGGDTAIGADVANVQDVFGKLFNDGAALARDGSQFDRLLHDDETVAIGKFTLRAMHTPGHTPACMTYVLSDGSNTVAFVGDTLFMPDYGTARCDFPGGDARTLYRSITKVLSLPPDTKLYMCHDYQPNGRSMQFVATVAEQLECNIHVRTGISEDAFVAMRTARDSTLEMPTLMLPSVQVNMRAGSMPEPEENGVSYIKIPLNAL
ncbi:MBL fold metallo-hydrolase [Burkholderia sp. SRS-W-2-2016]|uniref:MBL fold metallo-hydrolase n=1 Tax=Burkholderia sp. SRS-W-2-2016 TaxID=1926878 RepID=UPI00094B5F0D|nr:MBL fold metallo-hydrolase [Burkholderia sp. SRS-W-2-2016]OLL27536.1 MBL fold metallo-hydrolase [Burkholderia sp. SRS-W-2-2016]